MNQAGIKNRAQNKGSTKRDSLGGDSSLIICVFLKSKT